MTKRRRVNKGSLNGAAAGERDLLAVGSGVSLLLHDGEEEVTTSKQQPLIYEQALITLSHLGFLISGGVRQVERVGVVVASTGLGYYESSASSSGELPESHRYHVVHLLSGYELCAPVFTLYQVQSFIESLVLTSLDGGEPIDWNSPLESLSGEEAVVRHILRLREEAILQGELPFEEAERVLLRLATRFSPEIPDLESDLRVIAALLARLSEERSSPSENWEQRMQM